MNAPTSLAETAAQTGADRTEMQAPVVEGAEAGEGKMAQAIDMPWRRVPESNRSSRICNPSHSTENIEGGGKRSRFVHGSKSNTYGQDVNGSADPENESPGALAGATGVDTKEPDSSQEDYPKRRISAMVLRDCIDRCDPIDAALIMSDALDRMRLGSPIPPLLNAMDEARSWVSWATPAEHKAYCLACYQAMPAGDQAAFWAYVTGQVPQ